jgi:hypothetical protein
MFRGISDKSRAIRAAPTRSFDVSLDGALSLPRSRANPRRFRHSIEPWREHFDLPLQKRFGALWRAALFSIRQFVQTSTYRPARLQVVILTKRLIDTHIS